MVEYKPVCKECYRHRLTFFEPETTFPFPIRHIVTTNLNRLNCCIYANNILMCWGMSPTKEVGKTKCSN